MARLAEIDIAPDLLARVRAGDECAQAALYAAIAPATFALIRRLAGAHALAEDLFQDTLMTVFQRIEAYRGEAPLGAWVRQIAVSKCLMYLRSPWHRARMQFGSSRAHDEDPLEAMAPAVAGPRPEHLDVERSLRTLSPSARAIVWLFEVEGYSHEEIAHLFGRTTSFSKSQLARAHIKLRAWFEPKVETPTCTLT